MGLKSRITGIVAAMVCLAAISARAVTIADTGHFTGPDRTARLIAGARQEGALTLYSSAPVAVMTEIDNAFTAKYGVRVNLWRGGSGDILQRAGTEARGGRFTADVMETAGPDIEAARREKLLADIQTPVSSELMPEAVTALRSAIVTRLTVFTIAYNTHLIAKSDAPKSYDDLLNPKWKGKLGVEADDGNWLMSAADAMGGDKGLKLFHEIVSRNGVSVRKGHSLIANLVSSGEIPVALDSYLDEANGLKRVGAPIETVFAAPVIAMPTAVAAFNRAPHPFAAMLFIDFLLSQDAQTILARHDSVPTNLKVQHLLKGAKLVFMDVPKYLDESAKWTAAFRDVFAAGQR